MGAVTVDYKMPLMQAFAVRETVAGHRLGGLEGGGYPPPSSNGCPPPPQPHTPPPPNRRPNSADLADSFCRFFGFLNFADLFCRFFGFLLLCPFVLLTCWGLWDCKTFVP